MSARPLRLMAILAHPDDESLGVGGTLAKYAAEGVQTFLVTATRGQQGRFRGHREPPEHPGAERLGEIRERELRAAAAVLGVTDVAVLDYQDKALDRVDAREAVEAIAAHIRRVQPQVVVTFGPDGAYGHPDHIAISQFTTAAIVASAASARGGASGGQAVPHRVVCRDVGALSAGLHVGGLHRRRRRAARRAMARVGHYHGHRRAAVVAHRVAGRVVPRHADRQLRAVEDAGRRRSRSPVGAAVLLPRVQHRQRRRQRETDLFEGLRRGERPRRTHAISGARASARRDLRYRTLALCAWTRAGRRARGTARGRHRCVGYSIGPRTVERDGPGHREDVHSRVVADDRNRPGCHLLGIQLACHAPRQRRHRLQQARYVRASRTSTSTSLVARTDPCRFAAMPPASRYRTRCLFNRRQTLRTRLSVPGVRLGIAPPPVVLE